MRDGRELATALRQAKALPQTEKIQALRGIVDPYLQFVDDSSCEFTGLRLQDVWRYFRHTWVTQYKTTPGRNIAFLVCVRAWEFHPIVGVGAISSSIMQIRERDAWIGWHPETFLEFASNNPSSALGIGLTKIVDTAIAELFLEDFFEEQLISPNDLRMPSEDVIARLLSYGNVQRDLHYRLAKAQDLKSTVKAGDTEGAEARWRARARSHLYRSKRSQTLAAMLRSRMVLREFLGETPTSEEVCALVNHPDGRKVVRTILRKAKADRVGIAMADITVCGAVAPYGPILGGKLVSMLAASPEVVNAYRKKYIDQASEIASSMAGRPIIRPSQLVFLGTTSLYGVGSSQYNRLRMPAEQLGGRSGISLEFLELGKSEAYGTSHFGTDTVSALVDLVQQSSNGKRVNSIFGEGVSPKLRKIRQGLDTLKPPTDALLQHGRQRIIYGVSLIHNLREYLIGIDDKPDYIFKLDDAHRETEAIGIWWATRWLAQRIMRDDVLSHVEENTLVLPVRHGARVTLPPVDDGQISLFTDEMY